MDGRNGDPAPEFPGGVLQIGYLSPQRIDLDLGADQLRAQGDEGGVVGASASGTGAALLHFFFELGDLALQPHDIRVLVRVAGGHLGHLKPELLELPALPGIRQRRLDADQLLLDIGFPILEAAHLFAQYLDLAFGFEHHLLVHRHHGRQLVLVVLLEHGESLLDFFQLPFQPADLAFQKLRGLLDLLDPHLQVLLEVERGQHIGDLLDHGRVFTLVGQGEGDVGLLFRARAAVDYFLDHRIELDILAHLFNDLLVRGFSPQLRVQPEFLDDLHEPGEAHDALLDGLDALLGIARHRRHHEVRRDLLLLDQNEGRGL